MLIHVARLLARGIPIRDACDIGMISPLTDDDDIRKSLNASFEACI
jgi:nitric oxide reductase NorQ protein